MLMNVIVKFKKYCQIMSAEQIEKCREYESVDMARGIGLFFKPPRFWDERDLLEIKAEHLTDLTLSRFETLDGVFFVLG